MEIVAGKAVHKKRAHSHYVVAHCMRIHTCTSADHCLVQDCLACENHAVSGNALRRVSLGLGSAIRIQSRFQCPLEAVSKRFGSNVGAF